MRRWRTRRQKAKSRPSAASILVGIQMTVFRTVAGNACFLAAAAAMGFFRALRLIVAVVVGVVVVVLVVFQIDIVKHDSEDGPAYTENRLLHSGEHGPRKTPVLHDDDCLVDFAGDD